MSLKNVLLQVEGVAEDALNAALAALKSAGAAAVSVIENAVVTETQVLIAKIKQLPIATVALNTIEALEGHDGNGADKMAVVVAGLKAGLELVQKTGGLDGLLASTAASLEDLALEAGQSLYNDLKRGLAKVTG